MTNKKRVREHARELNISYQSALNKNRVRLKRLMNAAEEKAEVLLEGAAARHGVRIYAKQRIADVCSIANSGISDADYRLALMAHLDFVVATQDRQPVFAVELDGPGHDPRNDAAKNRLCEIFALPLARIRDRHLHASSHGLDVIRWLSELFFTYRAMEEAQLAGDFPADEPIDPLFVFRDDDLPGKETFPLCFSLQTAQSSRRLYDAGRLRSCVPFHFVVHRPDDGGVHAFATLEVAPQRWVVATESIYLARFGIPDFEVAEELASLALRGLIGAYLEGHDVTVRPSVVRERIHRMMRQGDVGASGGGSVQGQKNFGFNYKQENGELEITIAGPEDEPH